MSLGPRLKDQLVDHPRGETYGVDSTISLGGGQLGEFDGVGSLFYVLGDDLISFLSKGIESQ